MDLNSELKGRRAQEILDDPVFREAVDTIRTNILVQWNLTEADQADERESAYHKSRALDEILRELRILVTDRTMDQSHKKNRKGRK